MILAELEYYSNADILCFQVWCSCLIREARLTAGM